MRRSGWDSVDYDITESSRPESAWSIIQYFRDVAYDMVKLQPWKPGVDVSWLWPNANQPWTLYYGT